MSKKKEKNIENKEVEVINEVVTDNVEEVKEEEPVKDEKQIIMEDFISFYKNNVMGKSHVSCEVGKQIIDYFNLYTDSKVVYRPCGSCVNSKINYMLKMAKQKYNIQL